MRSQPQSQRNSNQTRGTDARAMRGTSARNKDKLKHDHDARAAMNPEAQKDQFGSQHNKDEIKLEQKRKGRPSKQNLAARESAQDTRAVKGAANRKGPARRGKNGGGGGQSRLQRGEK